MAGPEQGSKKPPEPGKPSGRADRDKVATPPLGAAAPKVQVIYFPKKGPVPPRRPTVSITELKAVGRDDDATDPNVVVTPEAKTQENVVPSGKARRSKSGEQ